jgi:LAGLIDADG endonuclease
MNENILNDRTKNLNLNLNLSNYSYSNEEQDNLKKGNQQGNLTKHIVLSETKYDLRYDVKNPNFLYFLGGFVEGEVSNSVSISVGKLFKYGVNLQPVFNVTQHENGLNILHAYKNLFEAGSVLKKSGSPHIWVYTIKGYKHIILRVIPFLESYVQPYSCKVREYQIFKKLVIMSAEGHQKNKETLIEMVKFSYTLIGKGKGRKRTLEEVLEIINDKESYFNNLNTQAI